MKSETKMRDFSLRLITILAWFLILWATVFLVGSVFQWSGLTGQLETAFFGSGFCAGMVLAALALLNVTANLNIISKAQVKLATGEPIVESKPGTFIKTLSVAVILIGIVVLSLWFAEWRIYKVKEAEAITKIESIAESKLAGEAIELIKTDAKIADLAKVREALSANIQSGERLSIIIPLKVKGVDIYYELTAWGHDSKESDKKISEADMTKFIPDCKEKKKFEQLRKGEIKIFAIQQEGSLRAFRLVKNESGYIILLIDTSRRSEYSGSSF